MGVEPFLIASASKMIISQRLGKRICPYCKKERELTESERKRVNEFLAPVFDKKDLEAAKFYEGEGCEKCGFTGYK
jgi:type IV pilus assembly protein PilB